MDEGCEGPEEGRGAGEEGLEEELGGLEVAFEAGGVGLTLFENGLKKRLGGELEGGE